MKAKRRTFVTIGLWVTAALVWAAVIGADVTSRREADTLGAVAEAAREHDSVEAATAAPAVDSSRDSSGNTVRDEAADAPVPSRDCIDVNVAGVEQLQQLPRIGPVLAQRLIDYRKANGRFPDIESLLQVKGIGPATVEKLKGHVCF